MNCLIALNELTAMLPWINDEGIAVLLTEEQSHDQRLSRSAADRAQQRDELHDKDAAADEVVRQLEPTGKHVDRRDQSVNGRQGRHRCFRVLADVGQIERRRLYVAVDTLAKSPLLQAAGQCGLALVRIFSSKDNLLESVFQHHINHD